MKTILCSFGLFCLISSCIQHQPEAQLSDAVSISDSVQIKYAEGFEVNYETGYIELVTHSIGSNAPFSDTLQILTDVKQVEPTSLSHSLNANLTSLACQSSTHLAFLQVLGELTSVKGLCGLNYIQSSPLASQLDSVVELCASDQVDMEQLMGLYPDLFLIYPFESAGKTRYEEKGIRTLFIAEYLEETPLARLEWIKLFGVLFQKEKLANDYFLNAEESYLNNRQTLSQESPRFILNLPYKDQWHMPSANSLIVSLIQDAGLRYYYADSAGTENQIRSTEQVWQDGTQADYWIIMAQRPADFTLQDLIAEEAVYATFKSVQSNQVIFCNTATTDYFLTGVIEPHVLLKDLLKAQHKLPDHEPVYFKLLE